jgi:hypothetical protein
MAVDQRLAFPSLMSRAYRGTAAGGTTRVGGEQALDAEAAIDAVLRCGKAESSVPTVPFAITYVIANGLLTGPGLVIVALT